MGSGINTNIIMSQIVKTQLFKLGCLEIIDRVSQVDLGVVYFMERCHFCDEKCDISRDQIRKGGTTYYDCPSCGRYEISDFTKMNMTKIIQENKHLIAGYLYEFNRGKENLYIFMDDFFEKLLNDGYIPRTNMQRLDRFLVNLYKADNTIGKTIRVLSSDQKWSFGGGGNNLLLLSYAKNESELVGMFNSLVDLGYMKHHTNGMSDFSISPKGFERAEQLLSTNIDSKSVFIAMGFKDDLSKACEKAIKPACKACGFEGRLISDKSHNNGITDEIIVEIKRSKFIIVDFTYNNSGAYFEAGYAQGLGRPIIRCCKREWYDNPDKGKGLHFDVRHYHTILWENHEHLLEELKKNIRANIPDAVLTDINNSD
jgi:nucleoside 2-deoxyribosyltransferase